MLLDAGSLVAHLLTSDGIDDFVFPAKLS